MTTPNKRLLREIRKLIIQQSQRDILDNDYIIHVDDTDTATVHALIKPPQDSVYRHKFIRLDLKVPENYPHSPPEVTFINHDGVRIHPNMYENGKCCSTILNTWGDSKYEKWTSSMGIETVLLTFHSFLDNNPYTYEPGGRDDLDYTVYVQHQSWHTCLIRYLQYEKIPLFTQFMHNYLLTHIDSVFADLFYLAETYPYDSYYTRCFEIDNYIINYQKIIETLQHLYNYLDYTECNTEDIIDFNEFMTRDYTCNICFDTEAYSHSIELECRHKFHTSCLKSHAEANNYLCPMCRKELTSTDETRLNATVIIEEPLNPQSEWIVNPLTKRRVKVGSRTYNHLIEQGIILTNQS